jgi:hypothetical protein
VMKAVSWDVTPFGSCKTRIGKLGTMLAVTSNRCKAAKKYYVTLMMKVLHSYETSVLRKATRRNIPGDDILHSHRRKNLRFYMDLFPYSHRGKAPTVLVPLKNQHQLPDILY